MESFYVLRSLLSLSFTTDAYNLMKQDGIQRANGRTRGGQLICAFHSSINLSSWRWRFNDQHLPVFSLVASPSPSACLLSFEVLLPSASALPAGSGSFCFPLLIHPPATSLPGSVSLDISFGLGRQVAPVSLGFPAPAFKFALPSFLRAALAFSVCTFMELRSADIALAPVPAGIKYPVAIGEFPPARRAVDRYDVLRAHGGFLGYGLKLPEWVSVMSRT
jgi:hypothetical protein